MTVRDPEVLDLLQEEPELLAIADALAETQRPTRPRFRPLTLATVATVAAAVVVLALVSPWSGGGGRGLVLERALAAIDDRGPVLHVVFRISHGLRVELATGKTTQSPTTVEAWYDKKRGLAHLIARRDGRVVADQTSSASARELSFALLFPLDVEAADYYRDALASGKAKVTGHGVWRGREVYWLDVADQRPSQFRVGVDRNTYQLVVIQPIEARNRPTGDEIGLLKLEYVPLSEAHFGKVDSGSPEGEGGGSASGSLNSLTPERARLVLGVPAVWAGPSLSGLPLDISLEEAELLPDGGRKVHGPQLHLSYTRGPRPLGPTTQGVEIVELPADSPLWVSIADGPPPPSGFADLTTSEVVSSSDGSHAVWTATVSVKGIWASIEAPSRGLAVAAARALRPIG